VGIPIPKNINVNHKNGGEVEKKKEKHMTQFFSFIQRQVTSPVSYFF
jgi:hypothetical protein